MNNYPYYINYNYSIPSKYPFKLKSYFNNFKLNSFLNGTQRTLSIVNQVIPIIKELKPIINNTKTMVKVMQEFKNFDNNEVTKSSKTIIENNVNNNVNSNNLTFFQ